VFARALWLLAVVGILVGLLAGAIGARAAGPITGTLASGATFKIEIPANWNRNLRLYSHGYVVPGSPNPERDAGDDATGAALTSQGYALAGSSYSRTGWALEQAFQDQTALLDLFARRFGPPARTIAWGHSLGGIITAGLLQKFPDRFSAALPMCGVLAGGVAVWNAGLDGAFVFKTLLAPNSAVQLVNIAPQTAFQNFLLAQQVLRQAQATPAGRARLALAAAVSHVPGWFNPASPEPDPEDFTARELNQFLWNDTVDFFFSFNLRAELEGRAGGNPSWNTDINYGRQLERSASEDEVEALYEQAGLSLEDDLAALERAPRIAADPRAVAYLTENIVFNGDLHGKPVLSMHTTGDGLVPVENEQAYASVVKSAGNTQLLRQIFVHRAGHCTFTPAETVAAFQTLVQRLDTGAWGDAVEPDALNARAAALGPLNIAPPAFFEFEPPVFLRPFDRRALQPD